MFTTIAPNKPRPGTGLAHGHPLARNLVARYFVNEGNGTRLGDVSPFGNHLSLSNMDPATDWVGSQHGGALDFDGSDDVATGSIRGTDQSGEEFMSLSMWFKTSTSQTTKFLVSLSGSTTPVFIRFTDATTITGSITSTAATTITPTASTITYSDGRWHHVALTFDGTVGRIYYDGVLKNTDTFGARRIIRQIDTIVIGRQGASAGTNGLFQLEDFRLYRRTLNASEVAQLYVDPYADTHRRTVWAPDRPHERIEVEARIGGDWINLTPDLLMIPEIDIAYGISGTTATDVVASSGSMSFALNNSTTNSAGLVGYYSPGHGNCRSGFDIGLEVRFGFVINGTRYIKFHGWLDTVDPIAGQHGERNTLCTALDWFNEAATFAPVIPTQIGQRSDQNISTLVSAIEKSPAATAFDVGDSTFAYSFDNSQSEAQPALTELQKIAISEFGRVFIKGDTETGGVLCFQKRTARLYPDIVGSYSDTMVDLSAPRTRGSVINRVKATLHPRRADATPTSILFTNDGVPSYDPGTTNTLVGYYTDPANRESRVGGFEMVNPVATTDYTFNRKSDGTGADMTAFFTVTPVYGGNSVEYTIVSSAATPVKCYMTKLQARGRGLYAYTPIDIELRDTASITRYGEAPSNLDMAYQNDDTVAASVARYVLNQQSASTPNGATVTIVGDDDTTIEALLRIEPDSSLTITESVTNVSYVYSVNHVSLHIGTPNYVVGEFLLVRGAVQGAYWTVGTSRIGTDVLIPVSAAYVAPF